MDNEYFGTLAASVRQKVTEIKKQGVKLNQDDVSDVLQGTYNLLSSSSNDFYNECLAAICHVADMQAQLDELNKTLLNDCIAKSRVFLYNDMIGDGKREASLTDEYARCFYTIDKTGTTLTKDQKAVYDSFMKNGRLVVSAPTSFGKTRLLEEILIAKKYKIAVIIFPTLALLAEQYKRLKSRPELKGYHISTSSKISVNLKNNYILMLTPERLTLFFSNKDNSSVKFDFFCVDEIYKADRRQEGNRKYFFADVIYRLAKYNPNADFYLIGPYIRGFSPTFLKKFNALFLKFKSEVVQKDYYDINALKKSGDFPGVTKSAAKKTRLTKTIEAINKRDDSKSLIFCKDKRTTQSVAQFVVDSNNQKSVTENEELADYIAKSVSREWSLVTLVRHGVAYHNGNIPRHIQELIVDAFDNKGGKIDVLACTTTLIEGVNTNAKNIIFFDGKVADTKIDPFTQKNIEGRAGRLTKHFLGKIYYLDDSLSADSTKDGTLEVELEIFGDTKPTKEAAIQLDKEDLNPISDQVYRDTAHLAKVNHIPIELLKSNKFISIEKQIELINFLRERGPIDLDLGNYTMLSSVLRLTHDFLFNDKDKKSQVILEKYLLPKSLSYILRPVSLKRLIDEDIQWRKVNRPNESVDKIISNTIKFYSDYIEYAWPRYLSAFDRLYNFVQVERGGKTVDFSILIAKLEYGGSEKHHILLREAGVPFEIIQKISNIFVECETPEQVYEQCEKQKDMIADQLSTIEYRVLRYYV